MTIKLLLGVTLALSLAACGSDSDSDSNATPLTTSQPFAATDTCPSGGVDVSVGSDTNNNGVLDDDEVTSTERLCGDELLTTPFHECGATTCKLYGRIEQDFTLTADKTWLLTENVVVGNGDHFLISAEEVADVKANGVTLTIEAGTHVQALDDTSLTITRGSKIMAEGTQDAPIVFASYTEDDDWNGLIIHGLAPVYPEDDWVRDPETNEYTFTEEQGACGNEIIPCNTESPEGKYYGGMDIQDSSGALSYVQLHNKEKTYIYYDNNKTTGLTLKGVGSSTLANNIYTSEFNTGLSIYGGGLNIKGIIKEHSYKNEIYSIVIRNGFKGNIEKAIINGKHSNYYDSIYIAGNDTEVSISNMLITTHVSAGAISVYKKPFVRIYNSVVYTSPAQNCFNGSWFESDAQYVNLLSSCSDDDLSEQITGDYPLVTESGALNETLTLHNSDPFVVDNGSDFTFSGTGYLGPVATGTTQEDAWWYGWTSNPEPLDLASPDYLGRYLALPDFVACTSDMTDCTVRGRVDQDYTLDAGIDWSIQGDVRVGSGDQHLETEAAVQDAIDNGVTLTVEPGVTVIFGNGYSSSLTITRGSKIMAEGTAAQPIVFKPQYSQSQRGALVLQGFSSVYTNQHCKEASENGICNIDFNTGRSSEQLLPDINDFYYGGESQDDSSGVLSHIIFFKMGTLEYRNHINQYAHPLSLMGVGYNTDISNIQIDNAYERNQHSGLLISGGTVNLSNIIDSHSGGLTVINGYKGNIQNLISINSGERSFIQNENSAGEGSIPSQVAIANFLAIGESTSNPLIDLGNHSDTILNNGVITDSSVGSLPCLSITDYDADSPSNLDLLNLMDDCTAGLFDPVRAPDSQNGVVDVSESGQALSIDVAGVVANSGITATDLPEVDNGSGFEFEDTDYMGAVAPETAEEDAWWYGWTEPGSLDSLSN